MNEKTIRETAYRIWEEQGKPHGQDFEHWLAAERATDSQDGDGLTGSVSSGVAPPTPRATAAAEAGAESSPESSAGKPRQKGSSSKPKAKARTA